VSSALERAVFEPEPPFTHGIGAAWPGKKIFSQKRQKTLAFRSGRCIVMGNCIGN
jgi:hypothetical protein